MYLESLLDTPLGRRSEVRRKRNARLVSIFLEQLEHALDSGCKVTIRSVAQNLRINRRYFDEMLAEYPAVYNLYLRYLRFAGSKRKRC